MKRVSATELTHNTRKVIREVNELKEPVVIMSYNLPVAILSPITKEIMSADSIDNTLMVKDEGENKYNAKPNKKKNPLSDFVGKFSFPNADPDAAINHNDIYDI